MVFLSAIICVICGPCLFSHCPTIEVALRESNLVRHRIVSLLRETRSRLLERPLGAAAGCEDHASGQVGRFQHYAIDKTRRSTLFGGDRFCMAVRSLADSQASFL